MLEAFRGACADLASFGVAERTIAQAGWSRVADTEASPVGPIIAVGRSPEARRMLEQAGARETGLAAFERDVAGERLYVVLSAVEVRGRRVLGCRMYDVDEARQISEAGLRDWVGRAESRRSTDQGTLLLSWEPGFVPQHDSFEYFHVPAESALVHQLGIGGVMLKADILTGLPREQTSQPQESR